MTQQTTAVRLAGILAYDYSREQLELAHSELVLAEGGVNWSEFHADLLEGTRLALRRLDLDEAYRLYRQHTEARLAYEAGENTEAVVARLDEAMRGLRRIAEKHGLRFSQMLLDLSEGVL